MNTPRMNNENLKLMMVSVLCLLGAILSAYLLYNDTKAKGNAGNGKPMALLEHREAKVRRKISNTLLWSNIEAHETLYKKDSVQTGEGAVASIRFNNNKALLELSENSLVVIDELSDLSMNFLRGSVVIRNDQGEQKITVKNGKKEVTRLPFRITLPEPLSKQFVTRNLSKSIAFQWQLNGDKADNKTPASLEFSNDKSFKKKTVRSLAIQDKSLTLKYPDDLPLGSHFFRLTDANGTPLSEPSTFRVVEALSLNPIWPSQETALTQYSPLSAVAFRWTLPQSQSLDTDCQHEIQISEASAFNSAIKKYKISAAALQATIDKLRTGIFYWRIQSTCSELVLSSKAVKYTSEMGKKVNIALTYPIEKSSLEKMNQMRFSWNTPKNAEFEYEIEVLTQDTNSNVIEKKRLKTNSTVWNPKQDGNYRWRVLAYKGSDLMGESTWQSFRLYEGKALTLRTPKNNESFIYWKSRPDVHFTWDKDTLTDKPEYKYRAEFAYDAQFSKIAFSTVTPQTGFMASAFQQLNDGKIFWRIQLIDASGNALKTSEVGQFILQLHEVVRAPASAREPASYNPLKEVKPLKLEWDRIENAERYSLSIFKNHETIPVIKTELSGTTYETAALKEGTYTWSVRGIDVLNREGVAMPTRNFVVTYGPPLRAPEIVSSEVQ